MSGIPEHNDNNQNITLFVVKTPQEAHQIPHIYKAYLREQFCILSSKGV
jgi:hypothetical protein